MSGLAVGLVALGLCGLGLVAAAVGTRQRPDRPIPTLPGWFARWQVQHRAPDLDPATTTVLRRFLTVTYRLALPLARAGVRPGVVTAAGLWFAGTVPIAAVRWPLAAAALCGVSAIVDGLDGAVAGLTDRASSWGFVLDSVVDRVSEVLFFVALVVIGGDLRLASAAWASSMLLEYLRARAGNAGIGEIAAVTIAERPTRVLCVVFGLIGAGTGVVEPSRSADIASGIAIGAAVLAFAQLGVAVHRLLMAQDSDIEPGANANGQ